MSITGVIENNSIKLPPGVHRPDGTPVEIMLPDEGENPSPRGGGLAWMLKYAGTIDGPEDLASEHDHYAHGTPKRLGK